MKQAHFSVATIDDNDKAFHCSQGGSIDTQVNMIVAALSHNTEMAAKVLTALIKKYDLTDTLKEIVNHESI